MSYLSDYANNVSQILQHRGDAQAQAALNRGKIWGTALSQIGETIGGIPAARQLQKDNEQKRADQAQQRQLTGLQMQQAQGKLSDDQLARKLAAEGRANTAAVLAIREKLKSRDPATREAVLAPLTPEQRLIAEQTMTELDAANAEREKAEIDRAKHAANKALLMGGGYKEALFIAAMMGEDSVNALNNATGYGSRGVPEFLKKIATFGDPPKAPTKLNVNERLIGEDGKVMIDAVPDALSLDEQMAAAVASNNQPEIIRLRGVMAANATATRAPEKATFEWAKLPDGSVRYMTPGEIRQQGATRSDPPKASTDAEKKAHGFAMQMGQAITILDQLEDGLSEFELYQIQTLPQDKLIGWVNRSNTSEAAKRYLRAFEQFTESRLRPVSGAAIVDTEYARDRRTYAKQFGETSALAADRKAARLSALQSLQSQSGSVTGSGGGKETSTGPKVGDKRTIDLPDPPGGSETRTFNGKEWVKEWVK